MVSGGESTFKGYSYLGLLDGFIDLWEASSRLREIREFGL